MKFLLLFSLSVLILHAQAQNRLSSENSSVHLSTDSHGSPSATYTRGDFQHTRFLQDLDGDGWCDLWCALFQLDSKSLNKVQDRDGDGMTDYEEMILIQNPFVADSFPRNLTPLEIQERAHQQALRAIEHDKKEYWKHADLIQEGLQNTLRASKARKITRPTTQERHAAKANLHTILKNQPATPQNGGYLSDSNSARVTQADTLWPNGSALFEDATGARTLPLPAP